MSKWRFHALAQHRARGRARKLSRLVLQPLSVFCIAASRSAASNAQKPLIYMSYAESGI